MTDLKWYPILNKVQFQGYRQMPVGLSMEDRWRQNYITFQEYYDWFGAGKPSLRLAKNIVVLEGKELQQLAAEVAWAIQNERVVRFALDGGLKYDSGMGWTSPKGHLADETGH